MPLKNRDSVALVNMFRHAKVSTVAEHVGFPASTLICAAAGRNLKKSTKLALELRLKQIRQERPRRARKRESTRDVVPLDDDLLARLRAFVKVHGEKTAAELFGLGSISIVRAAAGLGLRRGTVFVIKTKLDEQLQQASAA